MRLPVLLLGLSLAAPLGAQTVQPKFGAQKPEPKVEESAKKGRKHAEKKTEKKPEPRHGMVQKGPDHAKFGSTVDQTEIDRKKAAAEKKKP